MLPEGHYIALHLAESVVHNHLGTVETLALASQVIDLEMALAIDMLQTAIHGSADCTHLNPGLVFNIAIVQKLLGAQVVPIETPLEAKFIGRE